MSERKLGSYDDNLHRNEDELDFVNVKGDEFLEDIYRRVSYVVNDMMEGAGAEAELLQSVMVRISEHLEEE